MKNEQRKEGFTLVEILIVLGIIAILTPLIFTFYKQFSSGEQLNINKINVLNKIQMVEQKITIDIYNAEKISIDGVSMSIEYGDFKINYSNSDDKLLKKIYLSDELKNESILCQNIEYINFIREGYLITTQMRLSIKREDKKKKSKSFDYAFSVYARNLK